MSEISKRKKQLDEDYEELMEMADAKTDITISVVGQLLEKFNEYLMDMAEIASKNKYYDENLNSTIVSAIQSTILELKSAFSNIQPPIINVTPQLKFDLSLLQPVLNKLGDQNSTLINLVSKYNNSENENLLRLITSVVDKQNSFLDREFKQMDYSKQLNDIESAINKRPTEFKSKVTSYNNNGRIEEITTKIIK